MSVVERIPDPSVLDLSKQQHNELPAQEPPTTEQVENLLQRVIFPFKCHQSGPWKFFVVSGKAREELGRIMAEALRRRLENPGSEEAQVKLEKERRKPLRAPILIAATLSGAQAQLEQIIEHLRTIAASTQNLRHAAEEMGLTTLWRADDAIHAPLVKRWFGLAPDDRIVAFVYVSSIRGSFDQDGLLSSQTTVSAK